MRPPQVPNATLRVALAEYDTGWHDPESSLDRAAVCVQRAASTGARLVVLPEMCTTGFTMEPEHWSEPLNGHSVERLGAMAAAHNVWIMAGVSVRSEDGFSNVAAVFDPEGSLVATYAKQRCFTYAGEDLHYSAGHAPLTIDIDGVRVSPLICYDLRFPELFRAVAPVSDLIVVIANWPAARRPHWDALLPARAIENLAYVVGVNRTGFANGIQYDGGSVAYDPWGESVAQRMAVAAPSVVDVSAAHVASIRAKYPFLDDLVGHSPIAAEAGA
jgi:omega-amidase